MSLFDYTYLCIYSVVPRNAILGRNQVSSTIHSTCLSILSLSLFLLLATDKLFSMSANELAVIVAVIFLFNFLFSRKYFLNFPKQREVLKKHNASNKALLKLLGVFQLIFVYGLFIGTVVFITINRR